MIKTVRGLLAHGGQDRIRLSTIKGKMGYKIIKFQVIQEEPGEDNVELTMKIYKTKQTTINNTVNFTDSDLLAVNYYQAAGTTYPHASRIIFDNEIFNQDIYITVNDIAGGSKSGNYYLELEVMDLSEMGAEYTTLKDLRAQ